MTNKDSDNGDDNPEVLSAMLMLFNISHLFSLWCHCCHPEDFRVDILLPCQKDKILKVSDIRSILNCDCIQAEVGLRSKYPVSEILQSHKLKSEREVKYLSG